MAQISRERTGEFLKETLRVLKEKGGEYPSGELIKEAGKRLSLSPYEKSINNSGQYRWITNLRFYSIGLVKAGWVEKSGRTWKLTDSARDFETLTPIEIFNFIVEAYDKWNANRSGKEVPGEVEIEDDQEPEVLMEVKPDDITFQNLIVGITNRKIQIPPFQRSFVWQPSDIRYLLDSIYRGYPVGSFIFWKTSRKLPRTRNIGNLSLDSKDISQGTEISYVLDGQQRITSLYAAVKESTIDDEKYRFLFDLRGKKFIVGKSDDEGNGNLLAKDNNNLQISIGTIFSESRASYRQIIRQYPDEYEAILDNLYDRFVSYRFSVIQVIDQNPSTDEKQTEGVRQVVRMFSRINETGRKLTVVAKMVARCWGEGFDLRESLDAFFSREKELEVIREETLLQTASVILNFKKARSRDILDKTNIRKLEAEWDNIILAFMLAVEFVRSKVKVRTLDYLPFDILLVPLAYVFYKKPALDHKQTQIVENWFWRACLSNRYDATVEAKIEEDCDAFDELLEGKKPTFDYLIDWETLKSRLVAQRYNLRNAFVKTILALYSYADPKNLADGRAVSFEKVFSGYYKHNLHHIFPQAYLRKHEPEKKDMFDSVMNIMFIPAITNNEIRDAAPGKYLTDLQNENEEFDEILQSHYIPKYQKSGLPENKFLEFLDYRANQLFKAFRVRTGIASPTEEYFDKNPSKPIDILENRMRNIIHETLRQQVEGSYWGDYIPTDIQTAVDKKIQEDLKRHPYKLEEYMRDDVRITFLDIMDYSKIILLNWSVFGQIFSSKGEIELRFLALKNYRNPVKHGRELSEVDKQKGEAAVLWLEKILQ